MGCVHNTDWSWNTLFGNLRVILHMRWKMWWFNHEWCDGLQVVYWYTLKNFCNIPRVHLNVFETKLESLLFIKSLSNLGFFRQRNFYLNSLALKLFWVWDLNSMKSRLCQNLKCLNYKMNLYQTHISHNGM